VTRSDRLGWRLSLFLGGLYMLTLPFQPYPGSAAVKGLAISTLAAIAWLGGIRLLSLALAASSIGDVLLDVGPVRLFVPGLAAFLTAHLLYTALFVRRRRPGDFGLRGMAAMAAFGYAAGFAFWLTPELGALRTPVYLYIAVIAAMVASALCAVGPWTVPAGAILFLISDSILAINKFKAPVPFAGVLIWSNYYAAQFLIARGTLQAVRHRE
jgi:uncharacterized membrane protein YhhN